MFVQKGFDIIYYVSLTVAARGRLALFVNGIHGLMHDFKFQRPCFTVTSGIGPLSVKEASHPRSFISDTGLCQRVVLVPPGFVLKTSLNMSNF